MSFKLCVDLIRVIKSGAIPFLRQVYHYPFAQHICAVCGISQFVS